MYLLPDTRPYAADPVKNELLTYAAQLAHSDSKAQHRLAAEQLQAAIAEQLSRRHTLGLSVALNMAPDTASYTALMDALDRTLYAADSEQVQWFALPVVVVAGTQQPAVLNAAAPAAALSVCLANYPTQRPLSRAEWLPVLLRGEDFARIKPEDWFAAKQNLQAARAFADTLPQQALTLSDNQSVQVLYALGYGGSELQQTFGQALRDAALPLMQVWLEHLAQDGVTLFANPLPPDSPLAALAAASHTRQKMALDVFTANTLRQLRLNGHQAGAVLAAAEGGRLVLGLGDSGGGQFQAFEYPLSPRDNLALVQQHILNLLLDCQVDDIRLLHHALPTAADLPDCAQARLADGRQAFQDMPPV